MINLNTPLGEFKKTGIVKEIIIEKIHLPKDEIKEKVCLMVDRGDQKLIRVNEAFVKDFKGAKRQQGFWLTPDPEGNISFLSTIGRFMDKYGADSLNDLKDMEIDLHLGERNLLIGSTI